MLSKTFVSLFSLLATVVKADYPVAQADGPCVYYGGKQYYGDEAQITVVNVVKTRVEVFQVVINTFVQQNTILNYVGGVAITVTNAPTQILTVCTGTSTATNTVATTVFPGNVNVFQEINIINFPVVISTFIQQNTIIQGGGGVNIVINNAPTFILTTATGTSTVTSTVTSTSTATTGNTAPTSFILSPVAAAGPARRQLSVPQYISPAGLVIASCSDAQVFSLDNGRLTGGGSFLSVNEGVPSTPFVLEQAIDAISTTFTASNTLEWVNAAFSGGRARFCSQNGLVNALLTANATLVGCVPQSLFVIPAAACVNGGIVSSTSSSASLTSTSAVSSSSSTSVPATTTSDSQSESSSASSSSADTSTTTSSTASDAATTSSSSVSTTSDVGATSSSSSTSAEDSTSSLSSTGVPTEPSPTSSASDSSTLTSVDITSIPSPTSDTLSSSSESSTGVSSTSTSATSSTSATASPVPYPTCTGPPFGVDAAAGGFGGCLPGCTCAHLVGGGATEGFCENQDNCGTACTTNDDCAPGSACTDSFTDPGICGGPTCLDYTSCLAPQARMLAIRGSAMAARPRDAQLGKRVMRPRA